LNLLTNKKSPTKRDFSIDGVGIVNASKVDHLINDATITAKIRASNHSLIDLIKALKFKF
tara:strand:+ start:38 stop:217 length:180 start_codon:yes stop_codon:yes gene_type:complete